jgi:hypothetical protein
MSSSFLTHTARWDEKRSWYWQNLELVRALYPRAEAAAPAARPFNFVTEDDRKEAFFLLRESGLESAKRPLIGIQPSAGRTLKEWEYPKFAALIERLDGRGTTWCLLRSRPGGADPRAVLEASASPSLRSPSSHSPR